MGACAYAYPLFFIIFRILIHDTRVTYTHIHKLQLVLYVLFCKRAFHCIKHFFLCNFLFFSEYFIIYCFNGLIFFIYSLRYTFVVHDTSIRQYVVGTEEEFRLIFFLILCLRRASEVIRWWRENLHESACRVRFFSFLIVRPKSE